VDDTGRGRRVATTVGGQRIDVWVEEPVSESGESGGEADIAFRRPTLEQALDGLMGAVGAIGSRLSGTGAQVVTVEFGCEFGLELGSFVAIIGKATSSSSFKVSLEWHKSD
jgi:Trypsin-co-occurring domain 1